MDENQQVIWRTIGLNFDLENYLSNTFFRIIDPCLKGQLFKPQYFDYEGHFTIGEMPFVAFMDGVHSVVLEQNDFEYREKKYHMFF